MHLRLRRMILLCCCALTVMAQPPYPYELANSASYTREAIAQGSLFLVFGSGLGPAVLKQADGFPLQTELAGTSIQVTVGAVTVNAPMVYSWDRQVAAILPSTVPAGDGNVRLTYNKNPANWTIPIKVVRSAFGIYTVAASGSGAGIITDPQYALKSYSSPAKPGDTLIMWGTGLGPVDGNEASGPLPGNRFGDVEVYVGNSRAAVSYAGRSGCCAGLDQIAFNVPDSVQGCFVPVAVRYGGITSNFTYLPVSRNGAACADALGIPSDLRARSAAGGAVSIGLLGVGSMQILQGAGNTDSNAVARHLSSLLQTAVPESEVKRILRATGRARNQLMRQFAAKYGQRTGLSPAKIAGAILAASSTTEMGAAAAFTELSNISSAADLFPGLIPPVGSCTVIQGNLVALPRGAGHAKARDAGAQLSVAGPLGTRLMQKIAAGSYQVSFGQGFGDMQMPRGDYSITGTGGTGVAAFTARLSANTTLLWSNKVETLFVDRTQPLTIRWTGDVGYVLLTGYGGGKALACVEQASKGSLTVPAHIVGAMPAVSSSQGYLFLSQHPFVNRVTLSGLDVAYFADFSGDGKEIEFR